MSAAWLHPARNQGHVPPDGRSDSGRRLLVGVLSVLLVLTGLQVAAAPTSALAAADATGTGGQYVPITQANLVDTWNDVGLSTPLSPTPQVVQVDGQAGLPSGTVASIVATITVVSGSSQNGVVYGQANTGGNSVGQSLLAFEEVDTASNTVVIENGDDGKIKLWTQGTDADVRVDVQGYFTKGNGTPTPGGYVSGAADLGSTGSLALNQTSPEIQATGVGAVPSTATAIYANLEVDATSAGGVGKIVAFPATTNPPNTMMAYEGTKTTMIGTIIDLDAQGRLKIKVTEGPSVNVHVRVLGYFDGQPSNPAWTPLGYRVYQTDSSNPVAAGQTRDVTVAGVQGVPAGVCTAAGVVFHVEAISSTTAGSLTVWASDETMPAAATMNFTADGFGSNTVISRVGCSDGKIKVRNNSTSGSVSLVVDAQSYLSNSNVVGPALGSNTALSGSRGSQQNASRALNDRTSAAVNPTNGNLLLTQQLLNITGVGPSVNVGVRYNSLNDNRPTLNMGLFETQLYRNSDSSMTYTDPSGTAFRFNPVGNGTYNIPNDINAHLTRTVNGSPSASMSAGATYELVFHPSQITNVYVSDGNNLKLTETKDVTGQNKITYTYAGGKLINLLDTQGRTVTFGYSSSPNPTQPTTIVDNSLNRTITLAYGGPKGALSQVTAANGQNTTWAYNAAGKVSSITDGSGRRTDFTYDTSQRVSTEVFGANNTTVSGTWTWTYPSGTQTKASDPNSNVVTYDYTSTKQVIKVTDGRGKITSSAFNTHGDLTSSTSAANGPSANATIYTVASSNFTYNLTKVTSPTGAGGAAGRFGEATYPTSVVGNGATTDYRPTSTKDAQGNVSNLQHNTWGQVFQEDRGVPAAGGAPANGTWSYKYQGGSGSSAASCGGKPGQICSVTDGNNNTTSFTYNTAGNLSTKTLPAPLGAETYTYDAAGRLKTKVDGKGVTTYTCYDPDDRVFQVSTTSAACGTASGVRTTYDAAGNATGINNTTTSTVATVAFDAQNRPTGRTFTGGLNPSSLASSATYDRAGRILTMSDGGTGASNTTTYTYDASNNVVTLAEPGGSCPATPSFPNSTKCTKFTYDDNNQRTVTQYPNAVTSTVGYDNGQRWLNQTVTAKNSSSGATVTLLSRAWTYTSTTNVDSAVLTSETDESGNKFTYTYDGANELKTAVRTSSGGTTLWNGSWDLDNNGNRTKQVINGTTTNYKYNAADQLCWYGSGTSASCTAPSGATALTYDANGNQTGTATYTPFNQQTTTTGSVNYAYLGTTNTQRLAANNIAYTPNLLNGQTTQHTGSSTQKIIRDPGGKLIAWQNGSSTSYFITDRQDSVLLLTDTNSTQAQEVAEYGYLPYGNTYTNTGSQAAANPYRYISAFLDASTGNYKMGARYYNPTIGRFTQPDPSGQEFNRYNYSSSNPVTYADPSGLWSFSVGFEACAFGGCIGVEGGIDSDGDVTLQGEAGVGTPTVGLGAELNPEGNYDEGWSAGADASCTAGPATAGFNTDQGGYAALNSWDVGLPSCSATGNAGYTW